MIRITVTHYRRLTSIDVFDWESKTRKQARVDLIQRRTLWLFWVLPLYVRETIVG